MSLSLLLVIGLAIYGLLACRPRSDR